MPRIIAAFGEPHTPPLCCGHTARPADVTDTSFKSGKVVPESTVKSIKNEENGMKRFHSVTPHEFPRASKTLAILVVFLLFGAITVAVGQTETVLYTFAGGTDGQNPFYGLIADASGSLYGTTYYGGNSPCSGGCGVVFQLTPNGSSWIETVLYRFQGSVQGDGQYPNSGLVMDASGALYGTTYNGGKDDFGDVFKLTPPIKKGDPWTESILYNFTQADGYGPYDTLVLDKTGNLYGTTRYAGLHFAGMVFKLSPPHKQGGAWKEKVLHSFGTTGDGDGPIAGLVFDKKGALYGTTLSGGTSTACAGGPCGTVFKLAPPLTKGGAWTETILHSFSGAPDGALPQAALTFDSAGALYGTTSSGGNSTCLIFTVPGCGTVFRLTPPLKKGGAWKEKVLHAFDKVSDGDAPLDKPAFDSTGALYGTTSAGGSTGYGTVFKLTPPVTKGKAWKETTLYTFTGAIDGALPGFGALFSINGAFYGTTINGGPATYPFYGVVYKIVP
jgi:uncharacterized repeat protein (TIGR03803 family)